MSNLFTPTNEDQIVKLFLKNISRIKLRGEPITVIGTEHETGAGFIDVLARGNETGWTYIIEFKHPEGPDKMIGQLARYIGAYVLETGVPREQVFGVAVAAGFHAHTKYAAAAIQNTLLIDYRTEFLPLYVPTKTLSENECEISEGTFGYVYENLIKAEWAHCPGGKFSTTWLKIKGTSAGYSEDLNCELWIRGEYEVNAFIELLDYLSAHLRDNKRQVYDNNISDFAGMSQTSEIEEIETA